MPLEAVIVLAALVCIRLDVLTVRCVEQTFRVERTPAECVAMIGAVEAYLHGLFSGPAVLYIAAGCKRGPMM